MASGDTKTESYLRAAAEGTRADLPSDTCCNTKTQNLILGVANRIMDVEDEVEELKNNPDVVDIVDTYADLQAYDTSTLTDKDIIRVLEDSTHSNKSTYYRWNASTNQFNYIGEAGGGVNVVQTIGTSTTDVMSQKAVTDMIHKNANDGNVRIGNGANANAVFCGVAVGRNAKATGQRSVSIGFNSNARGEEGVAIGNSAGSTQDGQGYSVSIGPSANGQKAYSVAIGAGSHAAAQGEFNIGTTRTNGYNSSAYRLLTGLYDPQNDHDAATKGYVDTKLGGMTLVSISQTDYDNLGTKDPNTLYIITGA